MLLGVCIMLAAKTSVIIEYGSIRPTSGDATSSGFTNHYGVIL